jgi:hypothetical protein
MSDDEVRNILRAACRGAGSVVAWARVHGMARPHIQNICSGKARPGLKVRAALGIPPEPRGKIALLAAALRDCRHQLWVSSQYLGYGDHGPLAQPFTEFAIRRADSALKLVADLGLDPHPGDPQ